MSQFCLLSENKFYSQANCMMVLERQWDDSCPRVFDSWEKNGNKWVIQDLAPEDDERAIQILLQHLVPDEPMCMLSGAPDDPESLEIMEEFWRQCVKQRMSIGCYTEVDGKMTLVALNCCVVQEKDEKDDAVEKGLVKGESWKTIYYTLKYFESKVNAFNYLGLDKVLYALGLVVTREYRGERLGSRILAAREPLCKLCGIKGTSTVFTGPASQKSAARCGFKTAIAISLQEIADSGLAYTKELDRVLKLMVKRYDW